MSSHGSDAQEALCSQLVAVDDRSNALGLWAPGAIGAIIGAPEIAFMAGLVLLAVLVPSLAVAVRRLHDAGRSGWWLLVGLIPIIGLIIVMVFMLIERRARAEQVRAVTQVRPDRLAPEPRSNRAVGDGRWAARRAVHVRLVRSPFV